MLDIDEAVVQKIHAGEPNAFTPIGEVTLMGEPVAAGIKKRHTWEAARRVAREMYFADRLLSAFPAHMDKVPLFTYPVRREDGQQIGILTEDFTRAGTRVLHEIKNDFGRSLHSSREHVPEGLHRDIYDAFDGLVYAEAFRHMLGFAFDREVLIDYDDVVYVADSDIHNYEQLVENMTIIISRPT